MCFEVLRLDASDHQKGVAGDTMAGARLKGLDIDLVHLEIATDGGEKALLVRSDDLHDGSIAGAFDGDPHRMKGLQRW